MQASVLKKEAFEEVFSSEAVAAWDIDWGVFGNSDESPRESTKRRNLKRLVGKLRRIYMNYDGGLNLFGQVLAIKDAIEAVHGQRLEEVIQKYFSDIYQGSSVSLKDKENGVQLGTIAEVKLEEGQTLKFYVKTHSEGKLTSQSAGPKLVNPRELFIYKILENLRVGCETHFCARSPEDVYISTLDAKEGGEFCLFAEVLKDEGGLGASLWGDMGALKESSGNTDWDADEEALAEDKAAHNFVDQMAVLDALSRILRLRDLLNNPDNFGFFRNESFPTGMARVLDFRVSEDIDIPLTNEKFQGFLIGNEVFNYVSTHKTICFALRYRLKKHRVKTTLRILTNGPLAGLEEAMETAYTSVSEYLQDEVFEKFKDSFVADLETCHATLIGNYRFFIDCLGNWSPGGEGCE